VGFDGGELTGGVDGTAHSQYQGADTGVGVREVARVRRACAVGRDERPVRAVLCPADDAGCRDLDLLIAFELTIPAESKKVDRTPGH
jgi:hypothetical protein